MKINKTLMSAVVATLFSASLIAQSHTTHWGYTGHEGPENWGNLSADYSLCKNGNSQSPINISKTVVVSTKGLEEIKFDYKTSASEVINNGHTIQVNIKDGSNIEIDKILFSLKQVHFHTPSENQIDGKNFPLEAHFVHVSQKGEIAVIALMFEDANENQIIKMIWSKMPHYVGTKVDFTLSAEHINNLLPNNKSYYRFNGSLTTPPCSEGVRWLVLQNYSSISSAQTKEFLDIFHHENSRPIQSINARKVMQ